jgi:hypothetical protein
VKRRLTNHTLLGWIILALVYSGDALGQTSKPRVSPEWLALGWTLPASYGSDQIALFKGLNAARGTWSFQAEVGNGDVMDSLAGDLVIRGGSQAGMASAWNLMWSWPVENPQHAMIDQIMAMPEQGQFGLMLVRFGPVPYAEAQSQSRPKTPPVIFKGRWDAVKQTVSWSLRSPFEAQADPGVPRNEVAEAAFEMLIDKAGKISIQQSKHLASGQISKGGAIERTGQALESSENLQFLAGLHRFEQGSEIADPRITRYLPEEATDISLISERNGHMAYYRISADAFDAFLLAVWDRYRAERAAKPDSWVDYSEEEITQARLGQAVGRYEPMARSNLMAFDEVVEWGPLEKARSYSGPQKRSAAGATYFFDRDAGVAFHDAGYW